MFPLLPGEEVEHENDECHDDGDRLMPESFRVDTHIQRIGCEAEDEYEEVHEDDFF